VTVAENRDTKMNNNRNKDQRKYVQQRKTWCYYHWKRKGKGQAKQDPAGSKERNGSNKSRREERGLLVIERVVGRVPGGGHVDEKSVSGRKETLRPDRGKTKMGGEGD